MAATLGIVKGHGGGMKIYSEIDRGTTIKVLFPAKEQGGAGQKASPRRKARTAPTWRGSGTVMIVDDEPSVRAVAKKMLEHLGFDTVSAADGEEGLDLLRRHDGEIACVLLDLTMPRLDGRETFTEMRRIDPTDHPVDA